jgi:hypothetical protein
MIVFSIIARFQANGLSHCSRGQRPRENPLKKILPCKGNPKLCAIDSHTQLLARHKVCIAATRQNKAKQALFKNYFFS